MNDTPYWPVPPHELLARLDTRPGGLSTAEARRRQARAASIRLKPHQDIRPLFFLLAQFRNPIVLVIRTRRPFLASRPGRPLMLATLAVAAVTLLLPVLPMALALGFTPMPPSFLLLLASILTGYVLTTEVVKRRFYGKRHDA